MLASSLALEKQDHLVRIVCNAFNLPKIWGTPGYFLILLCNVTSEFGLSIAFLMRLPSHPFLTLKGLQYSCPSSQSLNFQLSACTSHTRFGKLSSIVTECLSLMLVFLASFFINATYCMVAISHKRIRKGDAISLKEMALLTFMTFILAHEGMFTT